MIDLERIRAETPGLAHGTHLLACGASLMPQPVVDAIVAHTQLEAEIGGYEAHAAQADVLESLYAKTAAHIGARAHEIAIVENATVAWANAFYALPLAKGARILTCEAEYASNYMAFLQRAKRDDLNIEVIPSDSTGQIDLAALEAAIDSDVGLIAITWIPTNGGLTNPAAEVGRIARAHGVPFLLDACQAAGHIPIDVEALGCDFLSATGRKYLRGPRGTGYLYVRENWIDRLEPMMIDLFAAQWTARDSYTLRPDARRFENWENAYALRMGLIAALDYLEGVGIEAASARIHALADRLRGGLSVLAGASCHDLGAHPSGIVSFSLEGHDPDALVAALAQRGISIATTSIHGTRLDHERRGLDTLLRAAPHYYNSEDEVDALLGALSDLA